MLILLFCKDRAQIRANLRVRINACISLCKMLNYPVADPSWGWEWGGGGGPPSPLFLDQTEARGLDPALLSLFMVTRLKLLSWFLHAACSQGIK